MNRFYIMRQIDDYLNLFDVDKITIRKKKGVEYYNIPCCFDIETTSAYFSFEDKKIYSAKDVALLKERKGKEFNDNKYLKQAWMYVWQLSIDGHIIIGRTWEEYKEIIKRLEEKFKLHNERRLIIYVHNLAFEFQFLKSQFNFVKVFANDAHKIIYGETSTITYRCSYMLSMMSLDQMGKSLVKHRCRKKVGDLDYNLIRTPATSLTKKEFMYCIYDLLVMDCYLRETMEKERFNSIVSIPLTKTGYVRRYCRKHCLHSKSGLSYKKIMERFHYDDEIYKTLKQCYTGAHTHASAFNANMIHKNVASYDFTSSYPAVLLTEKYPMGKAKKKTIKNNKEFIYYLKNYCCMFKITFYNIIEKTDVYDNIISKSKCLNVVNPKENNGKIISADELTIVINEVDYSSIVRFYDFDTIKVADFYYYYKNYLPKNFIECIIHFYKGKTELKDVEDKKAEYDQLKSMLNSIYGMCVTDIVRDEFIIDNNNLWITNPANVDESLEHYNNSKNRFIAYEWGVWCTSYARRNLFTGIIALDSDFIYCDTDSLKFINLEKHKAYFENYNNRMIEKLKAMCEYHKINFEDVSPKTIKGKTKIIGLWDFEGVYEQFKTLGSKRYAFIKNGKFDITIAGVNKKIGASYIHHMAEAEHKKPLDLFTDDLYFDVEHTGKLIHTYIDYKIILKNVPDYQGNRCNIFEKSSCHLEPTSYHLGLTEGYIKLLNDIEEDYHRGA